MSAAASPVVAQSTWTFTQGFLFGQASFLLIILVFIRYFVFAQVEAVDDDSWKKRRAERMKRSKLSTTGVPPPPTKHILSKAGYDMATHPAESSGWMNVLIAQILQGYRNDLLVENGEEGARNRFEKWLNPENGKMSWLDPIQVTGLSLGASYPLLSNARIRPADGQGRIRAEIDLDYLDSLSLSLSTSLLINFPAPRFAVLPVSLGVELVSIGGTMSIQIHEPAGERQHLHACLLPDFHLNLKTTTLLGSRAKLQDVPKLEQLIVSRIRSIIQDRLVHPHHLTLALPRILSPSVSPTPILHELGEQTMQDMSEALRQGVEGAVQKGLGSLLVPSTSMDSVTAVFDTPKPDPDAPAPGTLEKFDNSPGPPKIITEQVDDDTPSKVPLGQAPDSSPRITQRKIQMPTDFPLPRAAAPAPSIGASSSYRGATESTTSTSRPPVTPAHSRIASRSNVPHSNSVSPSDTAPSRQYHSAMPSMSSSYMSSSAASYRPSHPSHSTRGSSSGISVHGRPPISSLQGVQESAEPVMGFTPGQSPQSRRGVSGQSVAGSQASFRFRGQFAGPAEVDGRRSGSLNARHGE